jgi:hypothetical protein
MKKNIPEKQNDAKEVAPLKEVKLKLHAVRVLSASPLATFHE